MAKKRKAVGRPKKAKTVTSKKKSPRKTKGA